MTLLDEIKMELERGSFLNQAHIEEAIDRHLRAAVLVEREACAKIADDSVYGSPDSSLAGFTGRMIAVNIRKRP